MGILIKGGNITCGQGESGGGPVGVVEHPWGLGNQPGAENDLLLAEQADGAEGAREVVVVNVGRDAVVLLVDVHNGRVRLQIPAM